MWIDEIVFRVKSASAFFYFPRPWFDFPTLYDYRSHQFWAHTNSVRYCTSSSTHTLTLPLTLSPGSVCTQYSQASFTLPVSSPIMLKIHWTNMRPRMVQTWSKQCWTQNIGLSHKIAADRQAGKTLRRLLRTIFFYLALNIDRLFSVERKWGPVYDYRLSDLMDFKRPIPPFCNSEHSVLSMTEK